MKRILTVVILGMALGIFACETAPSDPPAAVPSTTSTAANPQVEQSPAYDLAVIEAGHKIDSTDPGVAHFQDVLNLLSRHYGESPQQIADKTVKAQEVLAAKGTDDRLDDIFHAMKTIAKGKVRISYKDALVGYILMRERGNGKG